MLLESKREQLICRDDLRYTDQVIATLQCAEYEPWLKAALLNIPDDDVQYHMGEIEGASCNGAEPLTLQDIRNYQRIASRAIIAERAAENERERKRFKPLPYTPIKPEKAAKAPKPEAPRQRHDNRYVNNLYYTKRVWSDDPAYYRTRTVPEIATEMGCSQEYVYSYCRRHGFTFRPQINKLGRLVRKRAHIDKELYPTDAAWYQARTIQEAADALGINYQQMAKHLNRHGYSHKTISAADINNTYFPYDAEWYADKTVKQIAEVMGFSQDKVRHYLKSRGIKHVRREPYFKSKKLKG